jgi:uncharacterized protein
MTKKTLKSEPVLPTRLYQSPNIPMAAIRKYARQVAERFHPDKIILFGSYAYGTPQEDSDVDLLVVMPAYNQTTQAIRILMAFWAPFTLDPIVRTPQRLKRGLEEDNDFLREIMTKGKVLYEKANDALGSKSRGRYRRRKTAGADKAAAP